MWPMLEAEYSKGAGAQKHRSFLHRITKVSLHIVVFHYVETSQHCNVEVIWQ